MLDLDEVRANLTTAADYANRAPGEVDAVQLALVATSTRSLVAAVPDMVLEIEELRAGLNDAGKELTRMARQNRAEDRMLGSDDRG